MMKLASTCPNSDVGVVWGLLCLHPNTINNNIIIIIKSPSEVWWPIVFAPFLIIINIIIPSLFAAILSDQILRDWWFDLYWTSEEGGSQSQEVHSSLGIFKMAAVSMETVNVCQNLWPHLYRKLPKGFPQDLVYILSRVGRIFWPKHIANEWPPFWKWAPTKSAKFQCSLVSMKTYI